MVEVIQYEGAMYGIDNDIDSLQVLKNHYKGRLVASVPAWCLSADALSLHVTTVGIAPILETKYGIRNSLTALSFELIASSRDHSDSIHRPVPAMLSVSYAVTSCYMATQCMIS